jgi:hypothetical protein
MVYLAAALTALLAGTSFVVAAPADACGEKEKRVCFGVDGGEPQGIDPVDVRYVAASLRQIARKNKGKGLEAMWTMESDAATRGADCQEWTLPVTGAGTVLALAKHITPRVNSSVLYTDIADTIDGGGDGGPGDTSLFGCGGHGGMMGVKTDPSNREYQTDEYKASKYKPSGILVKLVKAPPEKVSGDGDVGADSTTLSE